MKVLIHSVFVLGLLLLISLPAYPGPTATPGPSVHPNLKQLNLRLRNQWQLILKSLKNNKITPQEAQTLKAGLKSIRQEELSFFQKGDHKDITAGQQTQLNQEMDKNSATIGENKKSQAGVPPIFNG
jgi:hypothetical protein